MLQMDSDAAYHPSNEPPTQAVESQLKDAEESVPAHLVLRYSLRQLFWFVAVLSVTLAVLVALRGPSSAQLAMLLACLVVAIHLFSTALGTRLRNHSDELYVWRSFQPTDNMLANQGLAAATSPSLLHCRGGKHGGVPLWTALGVVVGGVLGAIALAATVSERATVSIAVGAISTAVLGGWFAFLGASFWSVLRQSWRDAAS